MKAKIIKTGEIVDVYHEPQHGQTTNIYKEAVLVNGRMWEEDKLDFSINSEVKEVDLEKIINDYFKDWRFDEELDIMVKPNNYSATFDDIKEVAKHFFELGIKAQHDNWKVVDNINHPQADRNKIYCVFTKDRYILATVINHPQDEELLQWKCTEFPHHRYDMCEGDKYMQIV